MVDAPAAAIAPEGVPIVIGFALVGALLAAGAWFVNATAGMVVAGLALALTGWCVWFFRDPARQIPSDPRAVVSPADGVVVAIDRMGPPAEIRADAGLDSGCLRVSVFMNVFDVHVNRSPVAGRVVRVEHRTGKFLNAALQKASEENERCSLVVLMPDGRRVVSVQIAGLVARRIVCRVGGGVELGKGQRYGLIRFGSRVDVFLPGDSEPVVKVGDRTVSGESVLARLAPSAV
ncbi:MAG: phosphatidylserine decarboxylase [Phycisphaerales bacterium]